MKLGVRPHYLPTSIFVVKTELDPFYIDFWGILPTYPLSVYERLTTDHQGIQLIGNTHTLSFRLFFLP
jgi:hypothetical protein